MVMNKDTETCTYFLCSKTHLPSAQYRHIFRSFHGNLTMHQSLQSGQKPSVQCHCAATRMANAKFTVGTSMTTEGRCKSPL